MRYYILECLQILFRFSLVFRHFSSFHSLRNQLKQICVDFLCARTRPGAYVHTKQSSFSRRLCICVIKCVFWAIYQFIVGFFLLFFHQTFVINNSFFVVVVIYIHLFIEPKNEKSTPNDGIAWAFRFRLVFCFLKSENCWTHKRHYWKCQIAPFRKSFVWIL